MAAVTDTPFLFALRDGWERFRANPVGEAVAAALFLLASLTGILLGPAALVYLFRLAPKEGVPFAESSFAANLLLMQRLQGSRRVPTAFWLGLCLGWLPARCASFEGSVTLGEVRLSCGLLFKTSRRLPTRWVSASARFSTPLLRLCRCCVLVLATSGALVVLPGISDADADGLLSYLQGG